MLPTVWYCMVSHKIAWYCIKLHGIAWHCVVLHGGAKLSPFISYRNMISHGYARVCLKYLRMFKIFDNLEY